MRGPRVCITVDFEPDCPPFMTSSFRGISEGAPRLLDVFSESNIPATYFATSEVAERFPGAVENLVACGHELGCHGVTHTAFDTLSERAAAYEIEHSARVLRDFSTVTSFRAPYLRFPDRFLPLLEGAEFSLDSSQARYKRSYYAAATPTSLKRVPASMTSSVIRLPELLRNPWLLALSDPVVLFVHPWEFVDLRRTDLRIDCRFRTGDQALASLRSAIGLFKGRGATFLRMREL